MSKSTSVRRAMQPRDQWVHFVMSQDEVDRMKQKMEEMGIRNKSSYLRKMALDGYCVIWSWTMSRRWFRLLPLLQQQPEPIRKTGQ